MIRRSKSRVVATGWSQQRGIDYERTFMPVCRIESQRLLLAIAAAYGWHVAAMDFSVAFLNVELSKEAYVRQTPGLETKNSRGRPQIMKLRRSICGSPKAWDGTIDKDLQTISFLPTASDACVYVTGSGDNYVMLTLYVDNLLITKPNANTLAKVRKTLIDKFIMTDFGDTNRLLGINIIQDKERGTISISQAPYVLSLLDRYGMAE